MVRVRFFRKLCVVVLLASSGAIVATEVEQASTEAADEQPDVPHPVNNPESTFMLDLPRVRKEPRKNSDARLVQIPSEHAVVSDVRDRGGKWVHQHAYLVHHGGHYWRCGATGQVFRGRTRRPRSIATSCPDMTSQVHKCRSRQVRTG